MKNSNPPTGTSQRPAFSGDPYEKMAQIIVWMIIVLAVIIILACVGGSFWLLYLLTKVVLHA